jgi:hypothetical protein
MVSVRPSSPLFRHTPSLHLSRLRNKSILRPEKRKYTDVQQNLKNGELDENPCYLARVDYRTRGYTAGSGSCT